MATTTVALEEEDDPNILTIKTEMSIEEGGDKTQLSERLLQQRRRCVYRQPKISTMTTKASIEDAENKIRLSEHL